MAPAPRGRDLTVMLKHAAPYLALASVALIQYLLIRERGAEDAWFYLFGGGLFTALALLNVVLVVRRGADEVERSLDERELLLQTRAVQVAYGLSMLLVYTLGFIEAWRAGSVFNSYIWIFGFMGGAWGVAYALISWWDRRA